MHFALILVAATYAVPHNGLLETFKVEDKDKATTSGSTAGGDKDAGAIAGASAGTGSNAGTDSGTDAGTESDQEKDASSAMVMDKVFQLKEALDAHNREWVKSQMTETESKSAGSLWKAIGGGSCIKPAGIDSLYGTPGNEELTAMFESTLGVKGPGDVFGALDRAGSGCVEESVFVRAVGAEGNKTFTVVKEVGRGNVDLKEKMRVFPGLTSIDQLLQWTKETGGPEVGNAAEKPVLPNRPRVMSIHDMAGGYQKMSDNDYLASFNNWNLVDVFVYFSHNRIVVPPHEWTALGHHHGKLVLGTIMFEGGDGSADAQVLTDNEDKVVSQLAALTEHYGFDGWLVNLESGWGMGKDPEDFCAKLRTALKKQVGDYAQVVVYPRNPSPGVFDKVDGVYVNYNWDESESSLKSMAADSGDHAKDVYLGFDAWGQQRGNTYTHDKHRETGKPLVQEVEDHGLSVAVFAPGFVLEHEMKRQYSHEARAADKNFWETMGIKKTPDMEGSSEQDHNGPAVASGASPLMSQKQIEKRAQELAKQEVAHAKAAAKKEVAHAKAAAKKEMAKAEAAAQEEVAQAKAAAKQLESYKAQLAKATEEAEKWRAEAAEEANDLSVAKEESTRLKEKLAEVRPHQAPHTDEQFSRRSEPAPAVVEQAVNSRYKLSSLLFAFSAVLLVAAILYSYTALKKRAAPMPSVPISQNP